MKNQSTNEKTVSAKDAGTLLRELAGRQVPFYGQVKGTSMLPWIKDGDTVTIIPLTAPPQTGNIIAFYDKLNSRLVTHRVIKTTPTQILTKGDNCLAPDPLMSRNDIAGRVICIKRIEHIVRFGMGTEAYLIARLSQFNVLPVATRLVKKIHRLLFNSAWLLQ